jgi:hypothetical protein
VTTVNGLPAHVLLVHAVVVLVPVSALLVAVWPAARRRWATAAAVLAVVTAISVPLATDSGERLERRVDPTPLLRAHTELGDTMVPWVGALAVVAIVIAARQLLAARRRTASASGPGTTRAGSADRGAGRAAAVAPGGRILPVVLAVIAVVVAAGSVVTVYRIGESGSRAAWTGRVSDQPHPPLLAPAGSPTPTG